MTWPSLLQWVLRSGRPLSTRRSRRRDAAQRTSTGASATPFDPRNPRRVVHISRDGIPSIVRLPIPTPTSLLIRERALVVNLETVRMIIGADQVYVLSVQHPLERDGRLPGGYGGSGMYDVVYGSGGGPAGDHQTTRGYPHGRQYQQQYDERQYYGVLSSGSGGGWLAPPLTPSCWRSTGTSTGTSTPPSLPARYLARRQSTLTQRRSTALAAAWQAEQERRRLQQGQKGEEEERERAEGQATAVDSGSLGDLELPYELRALEAGLAEAVRWLETHVPRAADELAQALSPPLP
eukprot:XP_001695409.1 predicted protein [Chlamydomonas reinhardtii]